MRGAGSKSHYEYEVKINSEVGERWCVYRRYSRFRDLHLTMKSRYGEKVKFTSITSTNFLLSIHHFRFLRFRSRPATFSKTQRRLRSRESDSSKGTCEDCSKCVEPIHRARWRTVSRWTRSTWLISALFLIRVCLRTANTALARTILL